MNRHSVWIMGLLAAGAAFGEITTEPLAYQTDGRTMAGYLAYPKDAAKGAAAVLVFPEWKGLDEYAKRRARELAELGYVVLAADMYGEGKTAKDNQEAAALAGALKAGNRDDMRKRAGAALEALKKHPLADPGRTAAIGYCFGGTVALELARSGADVRGVVSFHGGLDTARPRETRGVKAAVLILHGADDPTVPKEAVDGIQDEMREAGADWQMVFYGNAVHSFSNPDSGSDKTKGVKYDARADKRSWSLMKSFLADALAP
jgi:dienelactone hydrolase